MNDIASERFPYRLERLGVVMPPDPANPNEAEGVLNPAAGWADGQLYLLPRLVASGNVSRVGLARVVVRDGSPVGVERLGVVLQPDRSWERGPNNAGVEDPRVTWVPSLGLHVMTYVAYGVAGPRTAVAVSSDLRTWRRLGPVVYRWEEDAEVDLNLHHNKDTLFLPEPVTAPDGEPSFAVLHRPMGLPEAGDRDGRESIWMSFVPVAEVERDVRALTVWRGHRFVAGPQFDWEALKIGGGPPPVRVPEGWLLLHHGVTGSWDPGRDQQQHVHYVAGGMILDADEPWLVRQRTAEPLLAPESEEERTGIVPNVVFPTAIVEVDGAWFVFYGMADSQIGVARLIRSDSA
jgi:predicted GH43/DUF377 family glycosyl hydrolase